MCKFFSFIVKVNGTAVYCDSEYRRQGTDADSHSNIAKVHKISTTGEDLCNKYEWINGKVVEDSIVNKDIFTADVQAKMERFAETREFFKICMRALSHGEACLEFVREDKREATLKAIHEFACWSVEQSLPNYEKQFPGDSRVRDAIQAKRDWLAGKITDNELESAARSARSAESAARSAAWSTASTAASAAAWSAESAAWSTASTAARSAARSARSAAWSAARSAESAAWSTASAAAWSAARSAESAESAQQNYLDQLIDQVWPVKGE